MSAEYLPRHPAMAYLFLVRRHHTHPQIEAFTKDIMPDITIKQIDELERYTGPFRKGQDCFFGGKSLDLSKIGMKCLRIGVLNEENAPVRESRHETGQAQKR